MSLITTEAEYFKALRNIEALDTLIEKAYSYMERIPTEQEEEIMEIQDLIINAQRRRLGNWNLTKMYEVEFSDQKIDNNIYTVKLGDTLPYISYLKYGTQDHWQYIYHENNLTDLQLVTDTDLKIPVLGDAVDPFLFGKELFVAEFSVVYVETVLGEKL